MYDPFAQGIIENLPDLDGLTSQGTRRSLSRAYFALTNLRLSADQEMSESTAKDIIFLRRLANTLESRAVFDTDVKPLERRASAFVAAEALSLLANLRSTLNNSSGNTARIERETVFSRVEAGLLYIIAGYDANAGGVIREIPTNTAEPKGNIFSQTQFYASEWTLDVLTRFCTFHLNPLPPPTCPVNFADETPTSLVDLERDVRGRLYARLGEAVRAYMGWLTDEALEGFAVAHEQLAWLAQRLADVQYPRNADIHHLARLLLVVLENTEYRAFVHVVPPPDQEDTGKYRAYLRSRSKGPEGGSGRPLLWPSVQKYVKECLPGPNRHAVVSMPTGSGKSFLAELAASQALLNGWVLYLVPTNALAHQVRRDLRRDLDSLGVEVWAFIGGSEYTTLGQERVEHIPPRMIAVMTPEKCSLSMRLNPEAFGTCKLCIFDECQLIGEKHRGVVAELVLSQIMVLAPDCRYLLMSAIVQNPNVLAKWLHSATGGDSLPVPLDWRPTRSLRCAVGVDSNALEIGARIAKARLAARSDHFKNEKFEASFALLAGLQGAWQASDELNYAIARLPAKALLRVHRSRPNDEWVYHIQVEGSWVNESSRRLGEMLAEAGIPTLVFLPASKHYPFSVGDKVSLSDKLRAELPEPSERVCAFLTLAEDELGLSSEIANLIGRGVSVHTAALLETEKFASEESFRDGSAIVMLATGTLAQGLNLPAIAVVIGGTRIGYSPGEDPQVVEQRQLSQLLNASGRAGRAGFANQGLVVAIPDSALSLEGPHEAEQVVNGIPYLAQADASVEILSPLTPFIDSIAMGQFDAETASSEELTAAAVLVGGAPKAPATAEILRRTYAAYLRRRSGLDEGFEMGAQRLAEVRTEFVTKSGAPEWLPVAAQRAGLNFFSTLRLFQAWERVVPQLSSDMFDWDTQIWVTTFFEALRYLAPRQVGDTFGLRNMERFMPELHTVVTQTPHGREDNPEWTPPEQWILGWERLEKLVTLWMLGEPIKSIALVLLSLKADDISSERNQGSDPIPKTLAFVNEVIDRRLAMLAGGIVAIVEEELVARKEAGEDWPSQPPFELSTLPLSLKYGCASPQTLAWYRFGLRFRRPAHLLNQAFPLDPTVQDDTVLFEAVRDLRRQWLHDEISVPQTLRDEYRAVFDAIKTILKGQHEIQ
jgi:hypothetical protein